VPVPLRPPLPRPTAHSTLAGFHAYFAADIANEEAWDALHPAGAFQNYKPTDDTIKNIVIMTLADSQNEWYSSMVNRYCQTDHGNNTWPEFRADIEFLIQNNRRSTSEDPEQFQDRNNRRITYNTSTQQPHKISPRRPRHQPQSLRLIPTVRTRTPTTATFDEPRRHLPNQQAKHQPSPKPRLLRQLRRRSCRPGLRQPHLQQMPGHLPLRSASTCPLSRRPRSIKNHCTGSDPSPQADQVQHPTKYTSHITLHAAQRNFYTH